MLTPSPLPTYPTPDTRHQFSLDLDNQDDIDKLLKCIASGDALTDAAPEAVRPKYYQPVFKHPLPISAHSSRHDANLKRVLCCSLEKQAAAAVTLGDAWALEEVYMKGAPIDVPNASGYTPLHMAVQVNNFECVMVLIKMGANVNAQTLSGISPLFLAAAAEASECYAVIQEAGGVLVVRNKDEVSPMEVLEHTSQGSGAAKTLEQRNLLAHVDQKAGVPGRYTLF